MKNSKPWLVVSILASFAAISWIATAGLVDVEEDGVLWRYVYEGDVIPNQNLDAPFVLDRHNEDPVEEVVEDSGNQILRQTMKEGGWGWRIGGPGAHVGKDVALMLEMRARIVSGDGFLLGAELRNGDDGGAALKVSPDTVVFAISGVKENTQPQEIGNEFHVYRITVDSSGAKLYLDGNRKPLVEARVLPTNALWVGFGNHGKLDGEGIVEYDYVKWTWCAEASPPP